MSKYRYPAKTRETVWITRSSRFAEALVATQEGDVYVRPPSTHYPEAGELYVVSRKKDKSKKG